jgi:hypothetical protein
VNISLFNIDSRKIPNIPLLKIERHYKNEYNANIFWDDKEKMRESDAVFVSCVFTKNRSECMFFEEFAKVNPNINVEIGGSGYDIEKNLPEEIENIDLHINIGFTSRGCCRNCKFCIVPKKEGKFHAIGDIYNLWDGKSDHITIMDNNIFANFEHFEKISNQIISENLSVDFNQGLDIRLLQDRHAEILKKMKPMSVWRFAFDSANYKDQFIRGAEILKKYRLKSKSQIYFLSGFNEGFDSDIERLNIINDYGLNTFFMLYEEGRFISANPTEKDLDIIAHTRAPIGNKAKYVRLLMKE